jgi:hypothetical protein
MRFGLILAKQRSGTRLLRDGPNTHGVVFCMMRDSAARRHFGLFSWYKEVVSEGPDLSLPWPENKAHRAL